MSRLEDFADNVCSKHGIHKSMFAELVNKVKEKISNRTGILNNRIGILNNTFYEHKHQDSLNYPDKKKAFTSIDNRFALVLVDKGAGLICKQFYTSVIAKEVGLGLNDTTNACSEIR